jgi:hypothetical protein
VASHVGGARSSVSTARGICRPSVPTQFIAALVEAASDPIDPQHDQTIALSSVTDVDLSGDGAAAVLDPPAPLAGSDPVRAEDRRRSRDGSRAAAFVRQDLVWITALYIGARVLLVAAALVQSKIGHNGLLTGFANWDGLWYRRLANHGYPTHVSYGQTPLGFFPMYPITIWLVTPIVELFSPWQQVWASTMAGVVISGIGGWVATVFVYKLCVGWWDRQAACRATLLFIVFPGSVVFSMVYSEGILLPLVAVCLWALERRKWWLAGICAAFGTTVQPVGLVLGPVCISACLVELWRGGWRAPAFRASLKTPIMAAFGLGCFLFFMWRWTGNPMATYIAQHHGWGEKTNLFALVDAAQRMAPAFDPHHFNHPPIDFNLVFGEIGAGIMAIELVLLWVYRREVSVPAIVWTLAIIFLAVTSQYTPPNPRMVITAFPGLCLFGRYVQGRRSFGVLIAVNVVLLVVLSLMTFVGHGMRP